MPSIRRVSFSWTTLFSTLSTGDGTFVPTTGWMTAAEAAKVRATWEVSTESAANCVTRPGYQTANVENSADTPAVLGTDTQTSVGVKYGTALTDISSATAGKALVRFGIYVKLASGSALACVRVAGSYDVQSP